SESKTNSAIVRFSATPTIRRQPCWPKEIASLLEGWIGCVKREASSLPLLDRRSSSRSQPFYAYDTPINHLATCQNFVHPFISPERHPIGNRSGSPRNQRTAVYAAWSGWPEDIVV